MRWIAYAAGAVGGIALLVAALGAGVMIRTHAFLPALAPEATSDGALGAAAATPPPNCIALAGLVNAPAPPLTVSDLGNGLKKVTSAQGGYAIVVPAAWHVQPNPDDLGNVWFGQARMTSYDPNLSEAHRIAYGRMLAPEAGLSLNIEVWSNPNGESPTRYAEHAHIGPDQKAILPGHPVAVGGQVAYRTAIQDEFRFQPTSGPLEVTRQTRLLWIVPTLRADRVLVIYATPGESDLRNTVERAVETLTLSQPVSSSRPVVHQRDEILSRWLYDKTGAPIAGRRAEAKLLTYAEASRVLGGSGLLRIDRDPDELFWVVAVSGADLPQAGGPVRGLGLLPQGSPKPTAWILGTAPATNDNYQLTGMQFSQSGTWPPGFDALPDRCH